MWNTKSYPVDKFIENHSDLNDVIYKLKEMKFPYFLSTYTGKPTEETELQKWNRLNSFFHQGVVRTYSDCSGLLPDDAKQDLQMRFALVSDVEDCAFVESISGMSVRRLTDFIEVCQVFLLREFGVRANELLETNRMRFLKLKTIKK